MHHVFYMSLEHNDKITWVEIKKLKPHPKNPNKHSKEQIERLAEIIKYQGFRSPIVVSNRSGLIVAGHGRVEAAVVNGLAKVPVSYQDFTDDEQEYAHMVADNAIAECAAIEAELKIQDDANEILHRHLYDANKIADCNKELADKLYFQLRDKKEQNDLLREALNDIIKTPTGDSFSSINNENNWTRWAKDHARKVLGKP